MYRGSKSFSNSCNLGFQTVYIEFLDIDDNINISFHIRAIDQSEAIKMVKRKNTDNDKDED